ncbi:MAG: cation:proton antiporter [Pseudomonadota bacterium]
MAQHAIVFTIFLVFTGAAVVAALALYARQSLIVAYVLLGVLFGPSVLGLVSDPAVVSEISHIGIIFLLFLLGLNLNPRDLLEKVPKATLVTLVSTLIFASFGTLVALLFGLKLVDALIVGAATSFSSTILGVKLLPTTVLHHQRTGEVIISILLFQDLIAIVLLLVLRGAGSEAVPAGAIALLLIKLPLLVIFAGLFNRFVLIPLITRFDRIQEFVFLAAIGWCLGMAQLAASVGISAEIGAFIAGVSLATRPVALYLSESLKPLRDFFLILFFFSLGAGFDLNLIGAVALPALVLAAGTLVGKPPVFRWLLRRTGETDTRSREIGFRLGQLSEFSLLVAVVAMDAGACSDRASFIIQLATLLSFMASSYWIALRFPSPIAIKDELRMD